MRVAAGVDGWRRAVRLNERFLTQLRKQAVPLDARAVGALAPNVPALDAYLWLAATLPMLPEDSASLHDWDSLRERFADGDPQPARFQEALSASLELACACYPGATVTVREAGVELYRSPPIVANLFPPPEPPARPRRPRPAPAASQPVLALASPLEGAASSAGAGETATVASGTPDGPVVGTAASAIPAPQRPADPSGGRDALRSGEAPIPDDGEADSYDADASGPLARDTFAEDRPGASSHAARARDRASDRASRAEGRMGVPPALTGLPVAVWLRRGERAECMTIEVTPGLDYDPRRRAVLAVEPIVLQVLGTLQPRELDRIAAWVATNADLIQEVWDGTLPGGSAALEQVRRLPPSRW